MKKITKICAFIFIGITAFSCGESTSYDDPINTSSSNTKDVKAEEANPSEPTKVVSVKG